MRRSVSLLFTLLLLFSLLPLTAGARTVSGPEQPNGPVRPVRVPPAHLQKVPDELFEAFRDGMTIDEFIAHSGGRIPKALEPLVDEHLMIVVELDQAPLAAEYAESGRTLSAFAQRNYLAQLDDAQAAVEAQLVALDAMVISRYQKAYNGFLVRVPASRLAEIRALPGVRAVHRAPQHRPALGASVPLIRADLVASELGFDGAGVTIAVIDSGIDYTHAAFGGSGNPDVYWANNRAIITSTLGLTETFPTAKVIGGYDFAGPNYDASGSTVTETVPMPDPDPLDGDGHGTHVSSIAAGMKVTGTVGPGVAPGASLYALKVFGEPAGSTNLTMDAIEWAMDPNGDDDMSDHVDVINMSLGSDWGPGSPLDPDIVATNNAVDIGIFVAASAGNAGDSSYIVGSPSTADKAISVAASSTGVSTGPTITALGTPEVPMIYQPPSFDGDTGHFTQTITATLFDVSEVTTSTLCTIEGVTVNVLSDTVALIERGDCAFSDKVNNAAELGATGAMIYNNEAGGNILVYMAGDPVDIPAGFVRRDDGLFLQGAHEEQVRISAENDVTTIPDTYVPVDSIADFSSRGPRGYDSLLKPEITAPGVGIFAAAVGTGIDGTSLGGTSMASPHIAGVGALVRQAHSEWTPEQIKAAIMNTAVDLENGSLVPRYGAGRVDAFNSVAADAVAVGDPDLVSLSWGVIPIMTDTYSDTKSLTVRNWYTASKTYSVTWMFSDNETYTTGLMLDLPETFSVGADMTETMSVTLNIDPGMVALDFGGLEEYHGFVMLTDQAMVSDTLRVPFYVIPRPWAHLDVAADVAGTPAMTSTIYITHTGPVTSSLWAYPVYATDPDDPDVTDEGDLRLVGMDYGGYSPTYGDLFIPSINTWGAWHVPQPYFAEFDLYLDTNEDGASDLVDFNFNYGWWNGGDDNNIWVVIQVDLSTGALYLGSPYTIYTDFDAGFMEWYLPAGWHNLDNIGDGPNTDFGFELLGFGDSYLGEGTVDSVPMASFDIAHPPLDVALMNDPGPADPTTMISFNVMNPGAKGVMVVDYNGQPGAGQAYFVPFAYLHLPIILK
jgi:minor extracellular serine protease Vpr